MTPNSRAEVEALESVISAAEAIVRLYERGENQNDWPLNVSVSFARAFLVAHREVVRLTDLLTLASDPDRWDEFLAATETPEETLGCGHPLSAVVTSDEGTSYCGMCAEASEEAT